MNADAVATSLPPWKRVLAVVAHPDDESFALGALLERFISDGAEVSVLCLTRGEASTLGAGTLDLAATREAELVAAGAVLGVSRSRVLAHPDGALGEVDRERLVLDVLVDVERQRPDGILVFDPVSGVTGHEDHAAASLAAIDAAERRSLPVLGWALPVVVAERLNVEFGAAFGGYAASRLTPVTVGRERQRLAIACHASQAVPGSVLWRRLELLADREYVHIL